MIIKLPSATMEDKRKMCERRIRFFMLIFTTLNQFKQIKTNEYYRYPIQRTFQLL